MLIRMVFDVSGEKKLYPEAYRVGSMNIFL